MPPVTSACAAILLLNISLTRSIFIAGNFFESNCVKSSISKVVSLEVPSHLCASPTTKHSIFFPFHQIFKKRKYLFRFDSRERAGNHFQFVRNGEPGSFQSVIECQNFSHCTTIDFSHWCKRMIPHAHHDMNPQPDPLPQGEGGARSALQVLLPMGEEFRLRTHSHAFRQHFTFGQK